MPNKPTISGCLIVKNEADNIGDCIRSIQKVCDEIIICDTGSTDDTVRIINNYIYAGVNIKLFHKEWNDHFAEMRNYSLSKATGDYIFVIDGDEVLEQWQEITDEYDYYVVNVKSGNEVFHRIAVFRNSPEIYYEYACHAVVDNTVKDMKGLYSSTLIQTDEITKEELDGKVDKYIQSHLAQLETEPDNQTLYYYLTRCYYYKGDWEKVIEYGMKVPNLNINNGMKAFTCNMLYNAFLSLKKHEPNFLSMSICFLQEQTAARIPLAMFIASEGNKEMALGQIDIAEHYQGNSMLPMDFQFTKQQFQNFRKQIQETQ